MNSTDKHTAALDQFGAAAFWYEDFLGVFMSDLSPTRSLTCAWNWSGDSNAWEVQVHTTDGGIVDEQCQDFADVAAVIAYRDTLRQHLAECYLTHYLQQGKDWIKIAEYACTDAAHAERITSEIKARHPADVLKFELRGGSSK